MICFEGLPECIYRDFVTFWISRFKRIVENQKTLEGGRLGSGKVEFEIVLECLGCVVPNLLIFGDGKIEHQFRRTLKGLYSKAKPLERPHKPTPPLSNLLQLV